MAEERNEREEDIKAKEERCRPWRQIKLDVIIKRVIAHPEHKVATERLIQRIFKRNQFFCIPVLL